MADLIGTASIRVDMPTVAAARSVRRFATQTEAALRTVQRRVQATAADLRGLRGAAVGVTVDDRTAAGAAAVRAAVQDLQRLGPVNLTARLDTDVTDIAATTSALRGLQDAARGTSRTLGTLTTRATTAAAALVALGAAARTLRGDVDDLDGSVRRTGAGMTGLRGQLGTVTTSATATGSAMRSLVKGALLLSPALIPIAAQAAPVAAGLTGATVALGAFAAAAGGQISQISEAADAQKKYNDAVRDFGPGSAEASKAARQVQLAMKDMPAPTQKAAAALTVLKDQYRAWSDSLAGSTMPVATKSFAVFGALFPKLTPLVQGASGQLNRFMTIVAGGVASPGFDRFMRSVAEFSTGVLARANDALIRFVRTLDTGQVSGGVSAFMDYARQHGPLVRETLSNIAEAVSNLLQGAANVGPGLLTVVNALAGLVAAVPPDTITTLLQLALAIKAVKLAAAGMGAASGAMAAFGASMTSMRTAAAGATGVLPRLGAAFGTLPSGARLGLVAAGVGALVVALHELSDNKAPVAAGELSTALNTLASTGKVTGVLKTDLDQLSKSIAIVSKESSDNKLLQLTSDFGTWLGVATGPGISDAKKNLDAWDQSMADLVRGGKPQQAAAQFEILKRAWVAGGGDLDRLKSVTNDYQNALADQKHEAENAAQAMGLFGQQAQQTSAKLAEQKQSADGLRQAIQALNDVNRAGLSGMIGFEAAVDAASKAARDNAGVLSMQGGQLSLNTEKQRAAAQALQDLATKTDEAAGSARESGQSWSAVNGIYERGRQQLIANAVQMGLTRAEAEKLAATILKTPNKTALLKADITDWKSKIGEAEKQLKSAKGDKKAKLTADIADWKVKVAQAERQLLGAKASKQAKLSADIGVWTAKIKQAEKQLKNAKGEKKARLTADISDLQEKVRRANAALNSVHSKTIYLTTVNRTGLNTGKGGRGANAGGATGGLYTGRDFKYRGRRGYATGGLVDGPGTETSDSVFAPWLSKNEFVVNAKQTAQHLPLLKAINSGQVGMAGGGMAGAGTAVGAGLASGMDAAVSTVKEAARALAASVVTGIRQELQIASPSKKTRALAKDVGAGFISGLTGSRAKIQSVAKDLSNDIKAAFSGRRESSLLRMVNRETKELLELAAKRDAISKKIAEANKFASDTAGKARAGGSLASIVQQDAYSPKYVKGEMQASLKQIKAFTANVQKLQKKGLNKDLLRQILEMGPEQGAAFAASLAGADKATIKEYNSLNSQINKESGKLGKVGADLLYDSGKHAGRGFLTGLKAQQKDIERLMLNIAKAMQKSIRRALGIKSPSRVMEVIGRLTGLGLPVGITRALPAVRAAMRKVAATVVSGAPTTLPSVAGPGVSAPALAPTASTPQLAIGATRRAGGTAPVVVHEHHYHFENRGVIGSQMELDNWLARSIDRLGRTQRLDVTSSVNAKAIVRAGTR